MSIIFYSYYIYFLSFNLFLGQLSFGPNWAQKLSFGLYKFTI